MMLGYGQELRRKMILDNAAEYGAQADSLPWVSPTRAMAAEAQRARLLAALGSASNQAFKQTKPHLHDLAPGCRICGQGAWSCLFINGKCNCRCFYCPTAQDDISVPTTNRLPFAKAEDYVDYVRRFQFKGVSISGGEPLMTFERTRDYIAAVREGLGEALHIWLYTNGTLITRERLQALKRAGLNEIRIDLSAVDYQLQKVHLAAQAIPCVTVEIPAIPEDAERLIGLLPALMDAGVSYLNLHQLRLTPHNSAHLALRNYTYLHGENVTILESELAALSIMQAAAVKNPGLPINYCSFVYKRRYQRAAARRRNAPLIMKGHESVTESGLIRTLSVSGDPDVLGRQAGHMAQLNADRQQWSLTSGKERLYFHPALWPHIDFAQCRLHIGYSEAALAPFISYRSLFKEVRLDSGSRIFIEKHPLCAELALDDQDRRFLEPIVCGRDGGAGTSPGSPAQTQILAHEFIPPGLQDYF